MPGDPLSEVFTLNSAAVVSAGGASITLPAIAGIAWNLLSVVCALVVTSTGEIDGAVSAAGNDVARGGVNGPGADQLTWEGSIITPLNTAVTIAFTAHANSATVWVTQIFIKARAL